MPNISWQNKWHFARTQNPSCLAVETRATPSIPFSPVFMNYLFIVINQVFIWGIKYFGTKWASVPRSVVEITYVKDS